MRRNRTTGWKHQMLFLFAAVAVCLCGTGCFCTKHTWHDLGNRESVIDDRYYEYSPDGSEMTYTCLKVTKLSLPFFLSSRTCEPVSIRFELESARKEMIPFTLEIEPDVNRFLRRRSQDGTKTSNLFEGLADVYRDGKEVYYQTLNADSGIQPGDTVRLGIRPEDSPVLFEPCLILAGITPEANDDFLYYCLVFPQTLPRDGNRCEMLAYPAVSIFDGRVQRDIVKENKRFQETYNPMWYGAKVLLTPAAVAADILLIPFSAWYILTHGAG